MPRHIRRRELTRVGAPLAFLLAVTVLVLLVHSALSGGGDAAGTTARTRTERPTTTRHVTTAPPTTTRRRPPSGPAKRYYTIVAGDTFGTIAAKEGTTVAKLIALNPGVSSTALTIGERIRVG